MMNIRMVRTAAAGLVLTISSFANVANAGLIIEGTGNIAKYSVDYVEFELAGKANVHFEIDGAPYSNGPKKWEGYEFYLLKGHVGAFDVGAGALYFSGVISSDEQWFREGDIAGLEAGEYTLAVGTHKFSVDEAFSGVASSPYNGAVSYSYTIDVPEPASLALLGLGLAGLGFSRRKTKA